MSVIDLAISAVVLLGLWRGYRAGAVRTAMSLAAWLFGLVVASIMADELAPLFSSVVDSVILQIALAFIVVVLIVVVLGHVVAWMVLKTLKLLRLSLLDKIAGALLGAAKGVLKVLIIMSVTSPLLTSMSNWQSSVLAQALLPLAPVARQLLIEAFGEVHTHIENPYGQLSR